MLLFETRKIITLYNEKVLKISLKIFIELIGGAKRIHRIVERKMPVQRDNSQYCVVLHPKRY